ncbi:hypothetical protein MSG28_012045 [Choristoneura fumiferana]|uniref:Uncharacterized protein n=1 Tax=Choristoneura fumiferana TaxID=7141 RepID=A0ACC0KMS9_CHOFU|nr:hypothetical protein MSG28_012045 [Choristoneura fumiferana]
MQGFKTSVLLVVTLALLGLARAAPAEEPTGLEQLSELSGVEQLPTLLVRAGPAALSAPAARRCTASACRSACRALGWNNGVCLDAVWCMCFN